MWGMRAASLIPAIVLCAPSIAWAKLEHYERVRVLLMQEKARCTSCHVTPQASSLNNYGDALAKLGKAEPLAERMRLLDQEPRDSDSPAQRDKSRRLQDVDGDGVANWIELIAGANPGDAKDKPTAESRERVQRVVACGMCHTGTNLPGSTPLESNPHNELGRLLARTIEPKDAARIGKDSSALREAAEIVPILRRFRLTAMKPTGSGKPNAWDKLVLLYSPGDASATPTKAEMTDLRERRANRKNIKKRDPNDGMGPHKPDGFLKDAK